MWFLSDEERQLRDLCKEVVGREIQPSAEKHDAEHTFNIEGFKKLGEAGLLGITAPVEYGGAGMGALAATIAIEEVARHCASTALSYLAHSILCVNNIVANGSREQQEAYLPKLITGEHIGCMGMSEADYGSDALGMQAFAKEKAPQEGQYLLNGAKMWITNAPYADIAYVYMRTGAERKDLSTFLLERGKKQFAVGKEIHKMGMRASPTAELIFEDVAVPESCLVGKKGDSTYHMMKNLDIERITISGISLGIAKSCLDSCVRYVQERRQFGRPIGSFQMIQRMVAEMAAKVSMMESYLYTAAKTYDMGEKDNISAAKVKLAIPEMATHIALDAIQVHGGYGYSQEFPLERYMRDAKLMEIGAGTNEVMVTIIAKGLLQEISVGRY